MAGGTQHEKEGLGRGMTRRFWPHAHMCGTSPGWLGSMGARIPEANIDICRLAQNSRSVTHHAASMTCTVETLEARPVRVPPGGAGIGRAKSQIMPITCSRAAAADGVSIARSSEASSRIVVPSFKKG